MRNRHAGIKGEHMIQLDMFENDQLMYVIKELQATREMTENVRRGLFARYNQLERDVIELRDKIRDKESN